MENEDDEDRFPEFFDLLIKLEGGYVDNKFDKGGKTKYGITEKSYGKSVKDLTLDQAKDFYFLHYYQKVRDVINKELHYNYFDICVNSGYSTYLQALKCKEGIYSFRKNFYYNLAERDDQHHFLSGWLNRLSKIQSHFNAN